MSGHHIVVQRKVGDHTLYFEWYGGPYIQIGRWLSRPVEVINVWDYDRDQSRIPFTREDMTRTVDEWITAYGRLELVRQIEQNWVYDEARFG